MIDENLMLQIHNLQRMPFKLYTIDYESRTATAIADWGDNFHPNPAFFYIESLLYSGEHCCLTTVHQNVHCGFLRVANTNDIIVIGPIFDAFCGNNLGQRILRDMDVPSSRLDEFLAAVHLFPTQEIHRCYALLNCLNYIINNVTDSSAKFIDLKRKSPTILEVNKHEGIYEHSSYLYELELVSCIEYGRPNELDKIFANMSSAGSIPQVAPDSIRAFKNICINGVGIVSRAAIKGGMSYDAVNSKCTQYILSYETIANHSDLYALFKQMFYDFAQCTQQSRNMLTDTMVAKKVSKIVFSYINDKLTSTIIAEMLNMNANHLCRQFKKETGKTISQYVNQVKIDECKRLLTVTNLSIVQISEQLGYSSQNYLTKLFKNSTQMTPQEYRKSVI